MTNSVYARLMGKLPFDCHVFMGSKLLGSSYVSMSFLELFNFFMSYDCASWDRQLEQDVVVSDIESFVEENLQDELFKQGISDSQVYDLHRSEQALFSSSCSPWLSCELVWDELPFLYRCVAGIALLL